MDCCTDIQRQTQTRGHRNTGIDKGGASTVVRQTQAHSTDTQTMRCRPRQTDKDTQTHKHTETDRARGTDTGARTIVHAACLLPRTSIRLCPDQTDSDRLRQTQTYPD
eukprot:746386-Rhodomonas_salina.1